MADTGWLLAGTVSVIADHTYDWTNRDNIKAIDAVFASTGLADKNSSPSHTLLASAFGASIPSGASINGIAIAIKRYANSSNTVCDHELYYYNATTKQGDNQASAVKYPGTTELYATEATYGGATNTLGGSPTQSLVVSSDFGIGLSIYNPTSTSNLIGYIDYIKVKIYYTEGGGTKSPIYTLTRKPFRHMIIR